MTDTDTLRRLAEQAKTSQSARLRLAAAATPDVVLELLDELRSASGMSGRLVEVTGKLADAEADRDASDMKLAGYRTAAHEWMRRADALAAALRRWITASDEVQDGKIGAAAAAGRAKEKARVILAQQAEPAAATAQAAEPLCTCRPYAPCPIHDTEPGP